MRIAFIYPATEFDKHYHLEALPIGLLYLAASAEQLYGARVDVFDSRHGVRVPTASQLQQYDLVGFTSMSMQANTALQLVREVRESGYKGPIAFGGPHASVATDHLKSQPEIDAIFIGEAEKTFLQYLAYLDGKEHSLERVWLRNGQEWGFHGGQNYIKNLDELPFPTRDKYRELVTRLRFINMTTTRGCPFECNYCQPTKKALFGNVVRRRSVDNIMAEIDQARREFGITSFSIDDDTFTFQKKTVLEMCDRVNGSGLTWSCQSRSDIDRETLVAMRDSGCKMLFVGAESGSQRMLELMNKRNTVEKNEQFIRTCNELGIETWCNMMVGYPGETLVDMQKSLEFVSAAQPSRVCVTQVTPFPGTYLWEQHRDDVIPVDWDSVARHVQQPKFRSMAPLQPQIELFLLLMTRETGLPMVYDTIKHRRLFKMLVRMWPRLAAHIVGRRLNEARDLNEAVRLAREGDVPGAIKMLERLRRRNPLMHDAFGHLAWLYMAQGNNAQAVKNYQRLIKLLPNNAEAHLMLARALKGLGDQMGSDQCLKRALEIQPDLAQHDVALELKSAA